MIARVVRDSGFFFRLKRLKSTISVVRYDVGTTTNISSIRVYKYNVNTSSVTIVDELCAFGHRSNET